MKILRYAVPGFLSLLLVSAAMLHGGGLGSGRKPAEQDLLRRSGPTLECCPHGVRDHSRCLKLTTREVLVPGSRKARDACDRALHVFSPGPRGDLELDNDDFSRNGFQGATTADGNEDPPKSYMASEGRLAILSPSCKPIRESGEPPTRCLAYTEVDAFVAFDDGISLDEVMRFSAMHPWKGTRDRDRVLTTRVKNPDELKEWLQEQAQNCYVIRRVLISSHGSPGVLHFSEGDEATGSIPVEDMILNSGLSCLLAPGSRIQFDGCVLACGDSAAKILGNLKTLVSDSQRNPPGTSAPLDGAWFLFNTANGIYRPSSRNFLLGPGWHWNPSLLDAHNGAIMYSVDGASVSSDTPVRQARACGE